MDAAEYEVKYKVSATKTARRQGKKCGLTKKALLNLIEEVKLLKYWPDIAEEFESEKVSGAIEFKFNKIENKWIRVFAYQDDLRKIMWIIKVLAKKTNALSKADLKSLKAAVARIELDLAEFKKNEKKIERKNNFTILKGGHDE